LVLVSISFAQPHVEQGGTNPPTPQEPPNGWYKQTSGATQWLPRIFFLDKDTGWTGGPDGLYWTTNGGDVWELLTTKAVVDPHFIDGKNGWGITGSKTVGKSTDGGKTWEDKNVGIVGGLGLSAIEIFGMDTVYGLLSTNFVRSIDGGQTWTDLGINLTSNDMDFLDSKTGYICGDPQQWFKDPPPPFGSEGSGFDHTSDGGKIWIPIFPFIDNTDDSIWIVEPLHRIEATSVTDIFVAGDSTIYKSTNGGQSWQPILRQVSVGGLFFTTAQSGYAVGYLGSIYFTNDVGKTWTQQVSPVTTNLWDVFFVDTLHGWASGELGTIIHTTDGGKLWVRQYLPFDSIIVQTYPEPFNSRSTISYNLPKASTVRIRIYDALGKELQVFDSNGVLARGTHSVEFDGSKYSEGTFYYQIETNSSLGTGKMTKIVF
jgi:photosystem II stability/assembly factor-like uncharacterized protein